MVVVVVEVMVEVVGVEVMVEEVVVVVVMVVVVVVALLQRVRNYPVRLNFSMQKKVLGLLRRKQVEKMSLYIFRISLMVDLTILLPKDKTWNSQIYLMSENKNTEQQTFRVVAAVVAMVVVEMANMVLVVVLIEMIVVVALVLVGTIAKILKDPAVQSLYITEII